jgi:predicted nucleic acid-binding protein
MMRALIDTNILLDLVLDRAPFVEEAASIWEACRAERFIGYVSAISPLNVFYVVRRARDGVIARQAVEDTLAVFDICGVDSDALTTALTLPLKDFEDAVQLAGALTYQLDALVTRDPDDFAGASLPVYSPDDFLKELSRQ